MTCTPRSATPPAASFFPDRSEVNVPRKKGETREPAEKRNCGKGPDEVRPARRVPVARGIRRAVEPSAALAGGAESAFQRARAAAATISYATRYRGASSSEQESKRERDPRRYYTVVQNAAERSSRTDESERLERREEGERAAGARDCRGATREREINYGGLCASGARGHACMQQQQQQQPRRRACHFSLPRAAALFLITCPALCTV